MCVTAAKGPGQETEQTLRDHSQAGHRQGAPVGPGKRLAEKKVGTHKPLSWEKSDRSVGSQRFQGLARRTHSQVTKNT